MVKRKSKWLVVALDEEGNVEGYWDGIEEWTHYEDAARYSKTRAKKIADSVSGTPNIDIVVMDENTAGRRR
jgi:hypothetical protein